MSEARNRPVERPRATRLCDAQFATHDSHLNYLIEALALGAFMVSACVFTALVELPGSAVRCAVGDPALRRALVGLAMGLTAAAIVYSPWGKRSGAHVNPAFTLTMARLGRICPYRAAGYALAQFAGAAAGVAAAALALPDALADRAVDYVVTRPGAAGVAAAFAAELAMTFVLMSAVLWAARSPRVAPKTGVLVGALVAVFITVFGPVSGMSMNPARTFGSALVAWDWGSLWVYFTAPAAGMLAAAEVYLRLSGRLSADRAGRGGPIQLDTEVSP